MVNAKDGIAVLGSLLLLAGVSMAAGIPGTINIDNPFSSEDPLQKKYDLTTSITVQATDTKANLKEQSFDYETVESCNFCLNMIGPNSSLAFGGVNDARVDFQLVREDTVVADGSQWLGEIGAFQSRTVSFDADNLPSGDYTVVYRLQYQPDLFGAEQTEKLEKTVRVPQRLN